MDLLEFEDIKEIFLQFKSIKIFKNLLVKKAIGKDYLLISVIC